MFLPRSVPNFSPLTASPDPTEARSPEDARTTGANLAPVATTIVGIVSDLSLKIEPKAVLPGVVRRLLLATRHIRVSAEIDF